MQTMELNLFQEKPFHIQGVELFVNVVIFGADIGSSAHASNTSKSILILGEGRRN